MSTPGLGVCAKARSDGQPVSMRFIRNDFLRTYERPGALEQLSRDQEKWVILVTASVLMFG